MRHCRSVSREFPLRASQGAYVPASGKGDNPFSQFVKALFLGDVTPSASTQDGNGGSSR